METNNQLDIEKDIPNKKIIVTRHFNSSLDHVWRAWTDSDLLDQWWAPKPYKSETKTHEFRIGGVWIYAMVGPDNNKQWCKVEYTAIDNNKSFEAIDMFSDENGKRNSELPQMKWKNEFFETPTGTKVVVEISFESVSDLEEIVKMGFEEGFAMGLGNLDELLEHSNA